jgi:hypothetical protein
MKKPRNSPQIVFAMFLTISLVLQNLIFPNKSFAIWGGDSAVGDSRVVSLITSRDFNQSGCSGALLTSQVVITAAHCVGPSKKFYPDEIYYPSSLWVAKPGVDLNIDDTLTRVQVLQVVLTAGYDNTWDPDNKNYITQKDDIAFLFLEKELVKNYKVDIATIDEVNKIKMIREMILHIGYGFQSKDSADGKPYLVNLRAFQNGVSFDHPAKEINTIRSEETGIKALCPGDSGSPWYANVNGKEKIVAVTVGASGCTGNGLNGTLGTVIAPYLYLLEQHWSKFLIDLPQLRSKIKPIDVKAPLIQEISSCHAFVEATLQVFQNDEWTDFQSAHGWAKAERCPSTHPFQPWVRVNINSGTMIRWNIFSSGNWSVYTNPILYENKYELASGTKKVSSKKIVCLRGKTKTVVSGKNPKCPKGFKIQK